LGIILSTNFSFAQQPALADNKPKVICFSEEDAGKIVVDLEKYQKQSELVDLIKEENKELEIKIANLDKIIKSQDEIIKKSNESIENLQKLMDAQKEAYEKQIQESKPSIWKFIGTALGSLAVGLCIGLLI